MSFSANFTTNTDEDWIKTDLTGGTTYRITLTPSSETGFQGLTAASVEDTNGVFGLLFFDLPGRTEEGAFTLDGTQQIVFTPRTDSTWFVQASQIGSLATPLDYDVDIQMVEDDFADNSDTTGSIAAGGQVAGNIEEAGDADWFQFTAVAGTTYQFTIENPGSTAPDLWVYSADDASFGGGTFGFFDGTARVEFGLPNSDESLQSLVFTPSVSGNFFVEVDSSSAGQTGAYQLNLAAITDDFADNSNTTGMLTVGGTTPGVINAQDDADVFKVELAPSTTYSITVTPDSEFAFLPQIFSLTDGQGLPSLLGGEEARYRLGSFVSEGDDTVTFTTNAGGTYFLRVEQSLIPADDPSPTFTPVNYTVGLNAVTDDFADTIQTTGTITPGGEATGTLEQVNDADWFQANLMGGTTYRLQVNGDSEGRSFDDILADITAVQTSIASGTLTPEELADAQAQLLALQNELLNFDPDDILQSLPFTLLASSGEDLDPLRDQPGRLEVGLSGLIGDSSTGLIFTPQNDSSWFFEVTHFGDRTGDYTLSLEAITDDFADTSDTTGVVTVGGVANGTIEVQGDSDWFRVDLNADTTYLIVADTGAPLGFAGVLNLTAQSAVDSDGIDSAPGQFDIPVNNRFELGSPDLPGTSQVVFTPLEGGTYFIDVDSLGANPTDYTLSVSIIEDDFADHVDTTASIMMNGGGGGDDSITGSVADGYVSGAQIYVDNNGNGIPDPGEDTGVTTDANGDFSLPVNQATGPILAVGGTNIDTGLPNDLILSAPQGGTVVNPITSLIQEVIYSEGGTVADAEAKIQSALGIDADLDLSAYDPLAQDPGDDDAVATQSLAAQLAVLGTLSGDSDTFSDIVTYVLANEGQELDLGNFTLLQTMLPEVDDEVLLQAAGVNQILDGADSFDDISDTQESGLDDVNDVPVVNGEIGDQLASDGKPFDFQVPGGTIIDLDAGDSLTFTATLDDDSALPGWLSFDPDTQTFTGTPDDTDIDRLMVKVTATDESAASVSITFNLVVGMASVAVDDLDGTDGFRIDGESLLDRFGWSVSGAGDVNGDGFDDLIIGGVYDDPNESNSGSAYVVFGKEDGHDATFDLGDVDGSNGFALFGVDEDDTAGWSVSGAGDVNGDGFDDVIVGASNADPNDTKTGASYVFFGKADGFATTTNLEDLNGTDGFRLVGEAVDDFLGFSVSSAGDVNNDGFDDVIVGSFGADVNGSISGSSYIVFGKADGFTASIDLADLDGTNGFRVDGEAVQDRAGESVESAGDINGDGFDDLIIGAWGADNNGGVSGSSYVVFGKADGFSASMELADLDGTDGFRLDGELNGHLSGTSVSGAGDVNGDGYDDLIIGAHGRDEYGTRSGSSYVVFGKADGYSAVVELKDLDGSDGFRLDGVAEQDQAGRSVSRAGDVNGDGFDDLIIAAPFADPNGEDSGAAYLVYGKDTGFDAVVDLAALDGSDGYRLDGVALDDNFGYSVSDAGDINGDGADDFILGAPRADPNGSLSGSSYLIFGDAPDEPTGILVEGGPDADSLAGGTGDDTIIGNGGRDTLEGLAGNDSLEGGDDIDHAIFQSVHDDYTIVNNVDQIDITGPAADGSDELVSLERLHFTDKSVAFDLDGNAGNTAKLLGVLVGAVDSGLMGIGLDIFDNAGLSFEQVMGLGLDAILSTERSNEDVVNMIYTNLVGQAPSQGELSALTADLLDSGAYTQVGLALLAADHPLNTESIGLVGLIENGVEYLPV